MNGKALHANNQGFIYTIQDIDENDYVHRMVAVTNAETNLLYSPAIHR